MPFGRRTPLEALALPGAILAYKYRQYRQRRLTERERRVTEKELSALHNKIDKLLTKLDESAPDPPTSQEDECVICINARATMQTSPCGHKVVCRRCFVKTIQSAVAQRLLPLRCVICRARVNRLTAGSASWRIQESASAYTIGNKKWIVPNSASAYSVDAANDRVATSSSLYSMSSGSSYTSGISNASSSTNSSDLSRTSSTTSRSSIENPYKHSHNHATCPDGCLGAIPRNNSYKREHKYAKTRISEINHLPPIKEFRSPTKSAKPSPVHTVNPKQRFASYTTQKPSTQEIIPLINLDNKSHVTKTRLTSKVTPINNRNPINISSTILSEKIEKTPTPTKPCTSYASYNFLSRQNVSNTNSGASSSNSSGNSSNRSNSNSSNKNDEKLDNKKNESIECKRKDDRYKLKAEKEARKEEKRLAKEEEKLAKMLSKEEKKKIKKDDKELLLINNGRK